MARHKKILEWDDERSIGNSLLVTLKPGWAFNPHSDENKAEHVLGFDTTKEAMAAVRASKPCQCSRCKEGRREEEDYDD